MHCFLTNEREKDETFLCYRAEWKKMLCYNGGLWNGSDLERKNEKMGKFSAEDVYCFIG